jgi:hypothetical protein
MQANANDIENDIESNDNENNDTQGEVDLAHMERWQSKSSLYSQTVLDENCDSRRSSLPTTSLNHNATTTTSYTL